MRHGFLLARGMMFGILACSTAVGLGESKPGQDESPEVSRIDQRFASAVEEVPEFRKHIVPLLGKLGCNGRACHGSFQGQGGFQLSLFGYDFKVDHQNMLAGDEPRMNLEKPAESLVLTKPLMIIPHEGGERLKADSWQYRVLHGWIAAGAKPVDKSTPEFVRLEVTPSEIVAKQQGETFTLKAVAVWSDGSREDVTPLCRFQSNNDQIATIDETGKVTAMEPGDSHVVAFYDNGVVPVPVIRPVSELVADKYPQVKTTTPIDSLVVDKLKKLGVVPSDICTDAEFLRRVSLDITGTLPTADEVKAFLADESSSKRAKKIDELLERPGYAAWWATKMSDFTGANRRYLNNITLGNQQAMDDWYAWFRARFEKNMPYDEIARGVILATSRLEGESLEDYSKRMSSYYMKDSNQTFADQPCLPQYWSRTNFRSPEERSLGFAYSFLGIRIQCAQCHKHPFDQWTKDDFDRFKNFFTRVQYGTPREDRDAMIGLYENIGLDSKGKNQNQLARELKAALGDGKAIPFLETFVLPPANEPKGKNADKNKNKKNPRVVGGRTAKILGGEELAIAEMDDPREALMDWLLEEENPYFAKAFVNRVWATYFHRGIVEPTDDLSLANPPSNQELFDYLAREFVAHDYDIKWLHREICNSDTYQRSWKSNDTNRLDDRNFSHQIPRRLPAEIAYDAIRSATASDPEAAKLVSECSSRAIADTNVDARGNGGKFGFALTVFGRSIRESNCDCDRSMEASLLQTVFLQNDNETLQMIERRGGWVDQIVRAGTPASQKDVVADRKDLDRQLAALKEKARKARAGGDKDLARKLREEGAAVEERLKQLAKTEGESASDSKDAPAAPTEAEQIIEGAYLRSLSRLPSDDERVTALAYLNASDDLRTGVRDLLWALINTKEFVINH